MNPDAAVASVSSAPGARLRRRALLALVALLGLFSLYHLALQPALTELVAGVPYVNAYGRQRMLSQRLTKGVLAVQYELPAEERRQQIAEVAETLADWNEHHQQLLQSHKSYLRSSEIDQALADLDRHFQAMKASGEQFVALIQPSDDVPTAETRAELRRLSLVLLAEEPQFLARMDRIVDLYEAEVQGRARELRIIGWILFGLAGLVAVFLHFGVVVPAIQALSARYQSNLSRYQTLVENMTEGLALVDRRGTIQFANQRLRGMLQVDEQSLDGRRIDDFLVPAPGARAALRDALSSHEAIEVRLQRQTDPAPLDVVVRSRSVVSDGDRDAAVTLLVLTDISVEKAARERLRELQDQLSRVQRLKTVGEMSASLAHELGQPLGAISAFVGSCRNQLQSGQAQPEQVQEQLARIERAATRAAEILKRFRAYGRNTRLTLVPLDFPAICAEIQELCGPLFHDAGVMLHTEFHHPLPTVLGDPLLIQQVLINLMQNAVQALDGLPSDRRTLRLDIGPADEQNGIVLTLTDRGRGIPAELLPKLTEPFFTTRLSGLGLGLSICRTIMEDHEGHLSITSEPGVGATVRLQLPAALSEPVPADSHHV